MSALGHVFLLGTPNSGALKEGLNQIACANYLAPGQIKNVFNPVYPTVGGKFVTVYAGTFFNNNSDGFVQKESVHRIECDICSAERLPGKNFDAYEHLDLSSPVSFPILTDKIMPKLKKPTIVPIQASMR